MSHFAGAQNAAQAVGTPVDNQLGAWTGAKTIEGDATLSFDKSTSILTCGDGTISDPTLILDGAATGNPRLNFQQNGTIKAFIRYVDTGDDFVIDSDGEIVFQPFNTSGMRMNATTVFLPDTTNVGDNTTAATILAIDSTATGDPAIQFQQSGGIKGILQYLDTGDIFVLDSDGAISIRPSNSEVASFTGMGISQVGGHRFLERADHAYTPTATFGELWVLDAAPNKLIFTDDAGTDFDLTASGGGLFTEDGSRNIVGGTTAGDSISGGTDNFLAGFNAGTSIVGGAANVAIGSYAGEETTGSSNTSLGNQALRYQTTGSNNIGIGPLALRGQISGKLTGDNNIGIGESVGVNAQTAFRNTIVGCSATSLTSGDDNAIFGYNAAALLSSGSDNTIIGSEAGAKINGNSGNVIIGKSAGPSSGDVTDELYIHNSETDTPIIHGDFSTGLLSFNGAIKFTERANHIGTPAATFGELWVRNDVPNALIFTDDAGTDHDLTSGGGDVTKVGTPVDNQIGVWTGDGTIEGDTGLTFDTSTNELAVLSGNILVSDATEAHIDLQDTGAAADNQSWRISTASEQFTIGPFADDFSVGATALSIERTTNTIDLINTFATEFRLTNGGLTFVERSDHSTTPTATRGELWVLDAAPNKLIFTDDAGTDFDLTASGSGDVTKVGTPVNNELGVWTGDGTLEGESELTYDGTTLTVSGQVSIAEALTMAILSTAAATLTIDATHFTVVGTLAGTQTFTLPTAVGITGRLYNIKKTGASGTLTVDGDGSETIDGAANFAISTQYQSITVQSDGSNWLII